MIWSADGLAAPFPPDGRALGGKALDILPK